MQRLRAAQRHAEAGHHLVVNQHCAVLRGGLAQGLDEFGAGTHQVHIAGNGFQNHTGNLAGEFVKGLFQCVNVVIRQDDGVLRQIGGNACGTWVAESEQAGTGFHQQAVGVAVIAAFEFDDFVAPRVAARQTDGGHGSFRAGRYQAQAFDAGHDFGDFFGDEDFGFRGRAERQAVHRGLAHGFHHFGVCVSDNARAPRTDKVNVLRAVLVPHKRSLRATDKARRAAYTAKGADGRIHARRDDFFGAFK